MTCSGGRVVIRLSGGAGSSPSQAVGAGVTSVAGGGCWCSRVHPAHPWKGLWPEAKSTERKFNETLLCKF